MHLSARVLLILIFLMSLTNTSLAGKVLADVEIAERMEFSSIESPLLLNGAGIRTKLFFDIYIAALYLPERMSSTALILNPALPKRLIMHFVYSEVSKKKMNDGWQSGFEKNSTKEQMLMLQPRLDKFKTMSHDMKAGDVLWLDFLTTGETQLRMNKELMGEVEGGDFSSALLRVWLGDEPVTNSLKKDLLGLE